MSKSNGRDLSHHDSGCCDRQNPLTIHSIPITTERLLVGFWVFLGISVLKAVDLYLRKFRLKSGANQVDLGKAAEVAVDLYEHCTLVLCNGTK